MSKRMKSVMRSLCMAVGVLGWVVLASAGNEVTRASLQQAIEAVSAKGGGRVVVPAGSHFMAGPLHLRSNVELVIPDGAELVFSDDPQDYLPAVPTAWEAVECYNYSPLVYAYGCTNVAITGKGTLRAKMDTWRKWFARPPAHMAFTRQLYEWGSHDTPVVERDATKIPGSNARPQFVMFNRCQGVRLDGFRIRESPFWCVHLYQSEDCTVRNLDIQARGHNNDGIDVDMTRNVLIENCKLDQGDDGVVIKSGRNRDGWRINRSSENVEIRNCRILNGHSLLGIGSDLSGDIRNVWMHDCVVEGSVLRAFFLKTSRRRGGEVENIRMENCRVRKADWELLGIDTDVLFQFRSLPTYDERLTYIHDISFKNITCDETPHLAVIKGEEYLPVRNLSLVNVKVAKITKKPLSVSGCVGFSMVSESAKEMPSPKLDLQAELTQPILPPTAWMSSDRASRAPFGERTKLTRREVAKSTLTATPYGSLEVERAAYRHANGVELPSVAFVPRQRAGAPVVILGQTGRMKRDIYVAWALGAHRPALTFDLLGTGEIAGCLEGGKDADGEKVFAARMSARGESLLEVRVAELIAVLEDLKSRFGAAATVFAGSATYEVAKAVRARRADLVAEVVQARGKDTQFPSVKQPRRGQK